MERLKGMVALVAGAAQGMGEAHVRGFVAEGAKAVIADVNDRTGQVLVD